MSPPSHFFDIHSAEELFRLLKTVTNAFTSSRAKHTPVTPEELFYQHIFDLEEFKVLQGLCNRSKHMSATDRVMGTLHSSPIDDWPDVDSVSDFDLGAPSAYSVDDRDVEDVIHVVIRFYEDQWFRNRKGDGTAA
jgi:hypothetical protein